MSATMHTQKLSGYFGGIPHVHIGSSMFPVEEFYLEHVLRFVGFSASTSKRVGNGVGNGVGGAAGPKVFKCPICNSASKVFLSVVELGSHVALCNGIDTGPSVASPAPTAPEGGEEGVCDFDEEDSVQNEEPAPSWPEDDEDGEDDEQCQPLVAESAYASSTLGADISKADEELVTRYQQSWDDSMVDLELICSLMRYVFRSEFSKSHGTVLVFLPGWDDISKLKSMLIGTDDFGDTRRYCVVQLHSGNDHGEIVVRSIWK